MTIRRTLPWLGLCCLAVFVAYVVIDSGTPPAPGAGSPPWRDGGVDAPRRSAPRTPPARRELEPSPPGSDALATTDRTLEVAQLRIRVAFDDGTPAGGLGVLAVEPRAGRARRAHRATTGPDGLASLAGLPALQHVIHVRGAGPQRIALPAGETTEIAFTIPWGIGIEGRVVDSFGAPVVGATLWLTPKGGQIDHDDAIPVGVSQDGGRFRVAGVELPVNSWLAARAPGHGASAWRNLVALRDEDVPATLRDVELRLGTERASLIGTCVGPSGEPVRAATVRITPVGNAIERDGDVRVCSAHEYTVTASADGAFRFDGLATGTWSITARADGLWFAAREAAILDPLAVVAVELLGEPAASIAGVVTDGEAEPIAGAFVRVRGLRSARDTTDADGSFELYDLPSTPVELLGFADGFDEVAREIDLGSGTTAVRIVMARFPRLFGVARDARGQPLGGWRLGAIPAGRSGAIGLVDVPPDGAFELFVDDREPHVFCVASPDSPFHVVLDALGPFTPGERPLELVVPDAARADAALIGSLPRTTADRRYLLTIRDDRQRTGAVFGESLIDAATGRFRAAPLPAGDYWLQVELREQRAGTWGVPIAGTVQYGPYRLERGQTLDVGTLSHPEPGRLDCALTPVAGCEPTAVQLQWNAVDGRSWGLLHVGAGLDGSWSMVPGHYDVTIWGEGFLPVERRVTVLPPPATATRLELALEPGQRLPIELALPDGETSATFVIRDGAGRIAYEGEFGTGEARVVQRWPVIGRGRHAVDVTGASGRRFTGSFVVASLAPTTRPLQFELRETR